MAEWIQPIFNRTIEDVNYAKQKLKEWMENPPIIETEELRGCFNATDMNRINNNIEYIRDKLNELGYNIILPYPIKKNWTKLEIPIKSDFTKLIANINFIKDSFIPNAQLEPLPSTITNYESVNKIEQRLFDIKEYYIRFIANIYCDTFNSGSDFIFTWYNHKDYVK